MGRAALLEIDFQGWVIDLADDAGVTARARAARDQWRRRDAHVFCLRYLDSGGGDRGDPATRDAAFAPSLQPGPADVVLSKSTKNPFDNPDLDANLQAREVDRLVIDGLLTDHGVRLAALAALDRGYDVTVLGDACASTTRSHHLAALRDLASLGVTIGQVT